MTRSGRGNPGQEDIVDPRFAHACGEIGFQNPKMDLIESRRQHACERRAPAAAADNRQAIHAPPEERRNLKIRSLPALMRSMLPRCRSMIRTAAPAAATSTGHMGCRIIQQATGNSPAAMIDPSDK